MRHFPFALFVSIVGLILAGCSSSTGINKGGQLSGQVTIDGRPVTGGTVLLSSDDDRYAVSGFINEKGRYLVKEPPLGACKIAVRTSHLTGSVRPRDGARQGKAGVGSGGMVLPDPEVEGMTHVAIPAKYEDPKTTPLTYTVEAGTKEFDLKLSAK